MENEQITSVDEIDAEGGWLITHWTRTYDTRVPLTSLADKRAEAASKVEEAQAALDDIDAKLADKHVKAAVERAQAQEVEAVESVEAEPEATLSVDNAEATSSPAVE